MMVHMMIVQIAVGQALPPALPPPNFTMFILTIGLYMFMCVVGFSRTRHDSTVEAGSNNTSPFLSVVVFSFQCCLLLIFMLCDPAAERSISVHQTYGPADATATDWSGLSRQVYLSRESMRHREYFEVVGEVRPYSSWYEIRGLNTSQEWTNSFLCVLGASCVVYLVVPYFVRWLTLPPPPSSLVVNGRKTTSKKGN
jgi:hypothetical protein